LAVSKGLTTVC